MTTINQPSGGWSKALEEQTYKQVNRRIVSFLFILFVAAFLDRVNIGYAKLQFAHDLGLSNTAYGAGAGLFFIGYFFFEVPSNLLLARVGARSTMCRIMVLWGVISCATMFIRSETAFYILRFALGAAEAGFFPGVVLYLTYWFPDHRRAKAMSLFYLAVPVAGVLGAPLSAWLLSGMDGWAGMRGWQWMFFIEGVPSVVLGLLAWFVLVDGPEQARWLTSEQKRMIASQLPPIASHGQGSHLSAFLRSLKTGRLWGYVATYFCLVIATSGFTYWLPQVIQEAGSHSVMQNGQLTAIPYFIAGLGMIFVARSSERAGERKKHYVASCLVAALALVVLAFVHAGLALTVSLLSLAYIGVLSSIILFWPMPSARLAGAAAGGLAVINSCGNLAGYVNGMVIGALRDHFGNMVAGILFIAASLVLSSILVLLCEPDRPRHFAREWQQHPQA